jgi:hypothetical protein
VTSRTEYHHQNHLLAAELEQKVPQETGSLPVENYLHRHKARFHPPGHRAFAFH